MKCRFLWSSSAYITSILKRNAREESKKILLCWIKNVFIYFKIHVWCIMLDMSSSVKLLTHLMLAVKHLTLMSHLSHDSCWFYLFHNICLSLKFLVSRILSCLNIVLIISCWLNSFLLRVFKYYFLVIIMSVYCFCMCLLILLRSVVSMCVLKSHVLSFLNLSFVWRFLIFFMLMKS